MKIINTKREQKNKESILFSPEQNNLTNQFEKIQKRLKSAKTKQNKKIDCT